ncbi:hypothetical protein Ae201684P_020348 [Aphanomyces euteiches]|nr:hypothetical protein Ae201684P_020348 [Aphanomyces euteiches]
MSKKAAATQPVPRDAILDSLEAVRSSLATTEQVHQALTGLMVKTNGLLDEQKRIQDSLKAVSAARAVPNSDSVSEFVDFVAGKMKGNEVSIAMLNAFAMMSRIEKAGGLPPLVMPTSAHQREPETSGQVAFLDLSVGGSDGKLGCPSRP